MGAAMNPMLAALMGNPSQIPGQGSTFPQQQPRMGQPGAPVPQAPSSTAPPQQPGPGAAPLTDPSTSPQQAAPVTAPAVPTTSAAAPKQGTGADPGGQISTQNNTKQGQKSGGGGGIENAMKLMALM